MSSEFNSVIGNYQEALLLCRPRNILSFSSRFFKDEESESKEEAHAVHSLPFLLLNQNEFRSVACTIFCRQISSGAVSSEYLDVTVVQELIRKMDLPGFWFEVSTIETISSEQLSKLKKIDFNLFVSVIRFPIACYQLVFWLKDELTEYFIANSLKMTNSGINGNHAHNSLFLITEQFRPEIMVDLTKLKVFILQRYRSTATASITSSPSKTRSGSVPNNSLLSSGTSTNNGLRKSHCCPHMHQFGWNEVDAKQWSRVCVNGMDDLISAGKGNTMCSIEEITNAFMKKYLIAPIIADEM